MIRLFRVNTGTLDSVDTGSLQGRLLYDRNGNLIGNTINNKRQFEYVYDAQNRLITVSRYNTTNQKEILITFTYDALGRRTSKKVANVIYEYVYSGNDAIEEGQSNVNPTSGVKVKKEMREYIYGARGTDDIVSVRYSTYTRQNKQDILSTTGDYYYEKNHLGSIIRITSSTGAIVDEYSYTVFGKAYRKNTNGIYKPVSGSNDSPIGNTRLFTGREYDREVSLYYMRARYYDANLGRFISRDPIGMSDDVNLYRYVANNPMKYVDRMGLEKALILLGKEGSLFGRQLNSIELVKQIELNRLLSLGIKRHNIEIYDIDSVDDIQGAIDSMKYKHVSVITHGANDQIKIDKENNVSINVNNISEIHGINACIAREIRLISCNTGNGDNPIAQQLSNQISEDVVAPDGYVTPENGNLYIGGTMYSWLRTNFGQDVPSLRGGFTTFTPNK